MAYSNNDWEFLLNGSPNDLWSLSKSQSSHYFHIYDVPDHLLDCDVNDYRMKTIYCNNETDLETVWQIGYELISLFNGAARFMNVNFRKLEIDRLWNKEQDAEYRPNQNLIGMLGKPDLPHHQIAEEMCRTNNDDRLAFLNLATENEDVYLLLKLFDLEPSWINNYKIMETVESLAKREDLDLDICKSTRKSFTNVANNFSISGFDSRHGFKQVVKENKTPVLTLDDANIFIRDVAKSYVIKKYNKSSQQDASEAGASA